MLTAEDENIDPAVMVEIQLLEDESGLQIKFEIKNWFKAKDEMDALYSAMFTFKGCKWKFHVYFMDDEKNLWLQLSL